MKLCAFCLFLFASIPSFAGGLAQCERPVRAELHRLLARQEIYIIDCNKRGSLLICDGGASTGHGAGDISYVIGVDQKCRIAFYRETGRE